MKILLAGSGGFVGSKLALALDQTDRHSVGFLKWEYPSWLFSQTKVTRSSQAEAFDVDLVLLVGGAIPHSRSSLNDIEKASANVESTVALTKLPWKKGTRIVYLSSVDVYGPGSEISERTQPNPQSLYGMSKYFSEKILQAFGSLHGHDIEILRAATLYGPGDSGLQKAIPSMIKSALGDRKVFVYGAGTDTRNFLYIDDLVEILMDFIDLERRPKVVNLVGREAVSVRQVADLIARLCGVSTTTVEALPAMESSGCQFDQRLVLELFPGRRRPIEDGLRRTIEEWVG